MKNKKHGNSIYKTVGHLWKIIMPTCFFQVFLDKVIKEKKELSHKITPP